MNILQYPEEENNNNVVKKKNESSTTQLQVWNNAAFDSEEDFIMKTSSWSSSDCTKENLSPTALNTSTSTISSSKPVSFNKNIDNEIAEIESEIKRLTSRLEALRLEKAQRKSASSAAEKRVSSGRVVAAKFMEPKRNAVVFKDDTPKRNSTVVFKDDTPKRNAVVWEDDTPNNSKVRINNWRRGMSLGPAEIAGRMPPPATTPASRRKSCFLKPDEERRKTVGRANTVAGVGSIKSMKKKEEELIQPRKLFREGEGEKSVSVSSSKKVLKQGRVVASRYNNQCGGNSGVDVRKRTLPENSRGGGSEVRVKKRWEIPAEDVDVNVDGVVLLPKIRTLRMCVNDESPRDSGAAKRVSELNGKRSYFSPDQEVCQVLSFDAEQG